jgi:hypothetical protein
MGPALRSGQASSTTCWARPPRRARSASRRRPLDHRSGRASEDRGPVRPPNHYQSRPDGRWQGKAIGRWFSWASMILDYHLGREAPPYFDRPRARSFSDELSMANPPLICKTCFRRDGVATADVIEHRCTNDRTGKHFTAFVCARCLEAGRETRVTCRAFVPPVAGKR